MGTVKTAISLNEELFKEADKFSKRRRISRSRLFADAVDDYMRRQKALEITAKLNEIFSKPRSSQDQEDLRHIEQVGAELAAKEKW